jgi:hypothetical protein
MTLKIIDCTATPSSISVVFSDAVKGSDIHGKNDATNPANYTVQCPIGHSLGKAVPLPDNMAILYDDIRHTAIIPLKVAVPQGAWLSISVSGVTTISNVPFAAGTGDNTFATRVNGAGGIAGDLKGRVGVASTATTGIDPIVRDIDDAIEDAVSFPFLTEEVGYPPSPLSRSRGGLPGTPGVAPLGQTASKAISDVLGWQLKDDPKAFIGALNASFALKTIEGRSEATWTPRTYAVQTDLSGGITGAQASVYRRAKDALDQSLPLLDGLYPLLKEAKDEDVVSLRATVRSQFTDLVNELGLLGGPRISRISQLFLLLLGQQLPMATPIPSSFSLNTDPDSVSGSLGILRGEFGFSTSDDLVNTVEDEQDVTNFRIVSDYVTSLAQSWLNNLQFFGLTTTTTTTTPFFGTQLVLLSRQLSVVAESVNEVQFTLDSVFIGPAERQTLQIEFKIPAVNPPMFLEDLFTWIDGFASEEGPRLIQDGGKFAVGESFFPISARLQQLVEHLVKGPLQPDNFDDLPAGYKTARVQRSLKELAGQLKQLVNLAAPIKHVITPEPEPSLAVLSINPSSGSTEITNTNVTIIGTGFINNAVVEFIGLPGSNPPSAVSTQFLSENMLFAVLAVLGTSPGLYDVKVTQTVGSQTHTATLGGGFTVTQ